MAEDPSDGDRLPRDDAGSDVAGHHRDGVHDPRHDAAVGVDVRRRYIAVGTEQRRDVVRVAPCQTLELGFRKRRRIDRDATLCSAEGDVDNRALDRHVGGERLYLVDVHLGMKADPTLARTARRAVMDTPAGVDLDLSVVATDGDRDLQDTLRLDDHLDKTVVEAEQVRRVVDPFPNRLPGLLADVAQCPTSQQFTAFASFTIKRPTRSVVLRLAPGALKVVLLGGSRR